MVEGEANSAPGSAEDLCEILEDIRGTGRYALSAPWKAEELQRFIEVMIADVGRALDEAHSLSLETA